MESIQSRGEAMAKKIPMVGCGVWRFEKTGRAQLEALIRHGLNPWSKLMDFGCGALCGGYFMIHYLDPDGYCGIEPNKTMLETGIQHMLEPGVMEQKRPRFDHNTDFDASVFGQKFDFYHGHSIWTHAHKGQIRQMLDTFVETSADKAVFLTSFKTPVPLIKPDYKGDTWVGVSHESDQAGIVRHSFGWIQDECRKRNLTASLPGEKIHKQKWLRIDKN